jgi:hypothetical protein
LEVADWIAFFFTKHVDCFGTIIFRSFHIYLYTSVTQNINVYICKPVYISVTYSLLYMGRIQMYQEGLGKEVKFLGRVTTLGGDRFIITVPKEDVSKIKDLKGRRVFVTVKEAKEE